MPFTVIPIVNTSPLRESPRGASRGCLAIPCDPRSRVTGRVIRCSSMKPRDICGLPRGASQIKRWVTRSRYSGGIASGSNYYRETVYLPIQSHVKRTIRNPCQESIRPEVIVSAA